MEKYLVQLYDKKKRATRYIKCPDLSDARLKARRYQKDPNLGVSVLKVTGVK